MDLHETLAREQLEAVHGKLHAEQDAAEQTRLRSAALADRLRALRDDPEVQWFLETYVAPIVTREDAEIHDLGRTAEQANISRHRHALAVELHGLLEKLTTEKEAAAQPPAPKG